MGEAQDKLRQNQEAHDQAVKARTGGRDPHKSPTAPANVPPSPNRRKVMGQPFAGQTLEGETR